jgi:hypothetical protein
VAWGAGGVAHRATAAAKTTVNAGATAAATRDAAAPAAAPQAAVAADAKVDAHAGHTTAGHATKARRKGAYIGVSGGVSATRN